MKNLRFAFTFLIVALIAQISMAAGTDNLGKCWTRQVEALKENYFTISYTEKLNELYHSSEPWQQLNYTGSGKLWFNGEAFTRQDTLKRGSRTLYSTTQFSKDQLLFIDYGRKKMSAVTKNSLLNQTYETARYTPVLLIAYFYLNKVPLNKESTPEFSVYKTTINKTIVTLYIRKSDNLVEKITTQNHHELHGDILNTFNYKNYKSIGKLSHPFSISIEKLNGKISDEILVYVANMDKAIPTLLTKPDDYKIEEENEEKAEMELDKFSDNIYFINLNHTGSKVMVIEFDSFLLVAEAPLNSKNGELIIEQTRKIAPGKPLKYFAFGHHHPDYIGGMRAFIHKGSTVICGKNVSGYVTYLANASHSLKPDSLYLQPKPLKVIEVKDSLTITDGKYQMIIYHIGEKSDHTVDYLIYYFPKEKLVFEGDLVWIEKNGDIKKATSYQAGLYNAMKDLGLNVETLVQSWGIQFKDYKTVIPFEDLEKSMNVK